MVRELNLSLVQNFERAEAKRAIGMALFFPGELQDITKARQMFAEAMVLSESAETIFDISQLAGLYEYWITHEAQYGSCDIATTLASDFGLVADSFSAQSRFFLSEKRRK